MIRRRWIGLAVGFLFMMASASATHAQDASPPPRRFVTASALGSQDRPIRFENSSNHFTGWDVAAGVGLGAFLSERWSLSAEIEIPRRGQTEYSVSPPQLPPSLIVYWGQQEIRRRHVTTAGLVGFHPRRSGRIRPVILVGGTVARVSSEQTYRELFFAGSPWRTVNHLRSSATHVGVITGIDLETRVTAVLAIVARARGSIVAHGNDTATDVGDGDAGIARLGVGVRWMF